jgi:chromosomal replication initiator protein
MMHLAAIDARRHIALDRAMRSAVIKSFQETKLERARVLALAIDIVSRDGEMPKGPMDARRIIDAVCERTGFTIEQFRSVSRTLPLARWRQAIMYLAREMLRENCYGSIGAQLGNRDRTTIYYGWRETIKHMKSDPAFATEIEDLRRSLEGR